jgi:hypothetical protein
MSPWVPNACMGYTGCLDHRIRVLPAKKLALLPVQLGHIADIIRVGQQTEVDERN